jgi:hypothetical protein
MQDLEQNLVNIVADIAFVNGAKGIDVLLPPDLRQFLPQEIRNKFQLIQEERNGQT